MNQAEERVNRKRPLHELESSSLITVTVTRSPAIFNLPRSIFHIIFAEYLKLVDVAWFDNAVVNHQDRTLFLRHISNMIAKTDYYIISNYFLRWLFPRHILLSSVGFDLKNSTCKNPFEDVVLQMHPLNVSFIKTLKLHNFSTCAALPSLTESLKKCSKLKHLSMVKEAYYFKDLFNVPTFCCKLESLSLDVCATDEVLSKVATACPNLDSIILGESSTITDATFIEFLKQRGGGLKRVIVPNLSITTQGMSEEVAICIARSCPNLEKLEGCIDVTDTELIEFGKLCPNLSEIWGLDESTRWTDT